MKQVAIYRNLQKNCLSIQSRERENYGKIIGYCKSIFLKRPKFVGTSDQITSIVNRWNDRIGVSKQRAFEIEASTTF